MSIKKLFIILLFHLNFATTSAMEASQEAVFEKAQLFQKAASARDESGRTCLHLAAGSGDTNMCLELLAYGADVNAKDKSGSTPLRDAIYNGKLETALALIDKGADIYEARKFHPRYLQGLPLHKNVPSYTSGNIKKLITILLQEANQDDVNIDSLSPMEFALETNNQWLISLLIHKGADVNASDRHGLTALHKAAEDQDDQVCLKLIEKGANVNAINSKGATPLDLAIGCSEKPFNLLTRGPDIKACEVILKHGGLIGITRLENIFHRELHEVITCHAYFIPHEAELANNPKELVARLVCAFLCLKHFHLSAHLIRKILICNDDLKKNLFVALIPRIRNYAMHNSGKGFIIFDIWWPLISQFLCSYTLDRLKRLPPCPSQSDNPGELKVVSEELVLQNIARIFKRKLVFQEEGVRNFFENQRAAMMQLATDRVSVQQKRLYKDVKALLELRKRDAQKNGNQPLQEK